MTTALQRFMRPAVRSIRLLNTSTVCARCVKRAYSRPIVAENDIILLKKKGDDAATPILTKPLQRSGRIQTPRGTIDQVRLIGRGIRDVVATNKGLEYRIHEPSLADYVTLSPRIVTPVYPVDANLIVSLLDLHPHVPNNDEGRDHLEIFEAGTGHGALTLHLARAIHGANPAAPTLPEMSKPPQAAPQVTDESSVEASHGQSSTSNLESGTTLSDEAIREVYNAYLPTRRAVIHTLDISSTHSRHAQNIVRNFRHGLYYHNIDFHVGTIQEYISSRFEESSDPFLNHAILDLPAPHTHLEIVGKALKPNGSVVVFCPSITQINSCVLHVKERRLPLLLENAVEIGAGIGVGGRDWDVRPVKPRALLRAEAEARQNGADDQADKSESEVSDLEVSKNESKPDATKKTEDISSSGWEMVCRPKVGGRVAGGGFLGVFRRMEQY